MVLAWENFIYKLYLVLQFPLFNVQKESNGNKLYCDVFKQEDIGAHAIFSQIFLQAGVQEYLFSPKI